MIDPEALQGRWVHSHEEDTADEMVFRAADSGYAFPRSRGRETLELRPDGSYAGIVPGPTDKPQASGEGEWRVQDDTLVLGDRSLRIASAEEGVLRVRR